MSLLRATKVVRGTMESMGLILQRNPNMRIVHLVRDPRAVVTSRMLDKTFQGLYAVDIRNNLREARAREARVYCSVLRRDIRSRSQLQTKFPGRIIQVLYEDFVQNPAEYARALYRYMDYDIPQKIVSWVATYTKAKGVPEWARVMSDKERAKIHQLCGDIPHLVGYKWKNWTNS